MLQEGRKGLVGREGDLILKLILLVLTQLHISPKMYPLKQAVWWPGIKILVPSRSSQGSLRRPREQGLPALNSSLYLLVLTRRYFDWAEWLAWGVPFVPIRSCP